MRLKIYSATLFENLLFFVMINSHCPAAHLIVELNQHLLPARAERFFGMPHGNVVDTRDFNPLFCGKLFSNPIVMMRYFYNHNFVPKIIIVNILLTIKNTTMWWLASESY